MSKKHRVFVYGTLKKNYGNHRLLETSDFVGEAYTVDTFRMYCVGFPIIFFDDDGKPVYGEVYDVDDDTLRNLDMLEAEGRMYHRRTTTVQLLSDEPHRILDGNVSLYIGDEKYWADKPPAYTETNAHGELEWHR